MEELRREADGRRARGKAAKPAYQVRQTAAGTRYVKQVTDPRTGRRVTLSGASVPELMALVGGVLHIRRKLRAGLMSREEAAGELIRANGAWTVAEAWREYQAAAGDKGDAWRAKLPGLWAAHWEKDVGHLQCHEVTDAVLQRWHEAAQRRTGPSGKPYAPKTLVNAWRALAACLRLAVVQERIARVPWRSFTLTEARAAGRTRAKLTSLDQLDRLVEAARDLDAAAGPGVLPDLTMRLVVAVACGVRRGEGIALRWDHVDWSAGVVHLVVQAREGHLARVPAEAIDAAPNDAMKTERSRRSVSFEVGDVLHAALLAQKALLEARGMWRAWGPVFPTLRDGRAGFRARDLVSPETVRRLVNAAGIVAPGHWVQHSLRHSTASLAVRSGANVRDLRRLMGHTRTETLQGYFEDAGKEATGNALGGLAPSARMLAPAPEVQAPPPLRETGRSWFDTAGEAPGGQALTRARLGAARAEADLDRVRRREGPKMMDHAIRHVAAGGGGETPRAVLELARAAYGRAYNAARRAGSTSDECKERGRFARRATLGGYGRALKAARAASGREQAGALGQTEGGEHQPEQ